MAKRGRVQLSFENDPGLTEQSHRDACCINRIMARYQKTGLVPVYEGMVPQYEDFSNVNDYHTAMNTVIAAQELFMALPALVRKEFNNDPAEFLEAVENPAQRQKLIDLGIIAAKDASEAKIKEAPIPKDGSQPKEADKLPKAAESSQGA